MNMQGYKSFYFIHTYPYQCICIPTYMEEVSGGCVCVRSCELICKQIILYRYTIWRVRNLDTHLGISRVSSYKGTESVCALICKCMSIVFAHKNKFLHTYVSPHKIYRKEWYIAIGSTLIDFLGIRTRMCPSLKDCGSNVRVKTNAGNHNVNY